MVSVEVQNDFVLVAADGGGVDFQPTRSWRLLVEPPTEHGDRSPDDRLADAATSAQASSSFATARSTDAIRPPSARSG